MDNTIQIGKDGDSWFAVLPDFINLAESDSYFGRTPQEALENLMNTVDRNTLGHYFG